MPSASEARAQRLIIVAIFFVSSLQFILFVPQETITSPVRPSFSGGTFSIRSRSISSISAADGSNRENSKIEGSSLHNNTNTSITTTNGNNDNGAPLVTPPDSTVVRSTANKTKIVFCKTCSFNDRISCNERMQFLMGKHKLSESNAREELMPACGIDYYNEPYVLMHAGPHKTGTTTIQSFLYRTALWRNASYLQQDKFAIPTFLELPGAFGDIGCMLNFAHCMIRGFAKEGGQMNVAMCNRLRKTFPPFLRKHYNQSQHVLLVAEDLDRMTIDHTRMQFYLKPYRRFRIIVAYRRLHSWLPSWYNQIVDLYQGKYVQNETRFPSFVEWIDEQYDKFLQVHAMAVAARYENSGKFESVQILNLHEKTPLLEQIFCKYVPFADATCQAVREGARESNPNRGRGHEWERLATFAFHRGKIKDYHRVIAPSVIEKMVNGAKQRGIFGEDVTDYPKICLNETFMDQLLKKEIEQETKYFPEWYVSQGGEGGLRIDFEKSKHKLCSMDVDKILDEGILDPIFDEINTQTFTYKSGK